MILLTINIINNTKQFHNKVELTDDASLEITKKNIFSILRTLENHNVHVTFFVEISLIEKAADLLQKIVEKGHEISLYCDHGNLDSIEKAKKSAEQTVEKIIRGIRLKEIAFPVAALKSLEFNYISTLENSDILFPFRRLKKSTEIAEKNGVSIIPESISPYSQIPYNDFVFQVVPLTYYQSMVFETIKNEDFVLIYLNSWQFTNFSDHHLKAPFYRKFGSGKKMEDKLDDFLKWINENEIATSRIKDYLF